MTNRPTWAQRPTELANLFNPAYTSILLSRVSEGYVAQSGAVMPYPVAFIAMPLVIYPSLGINLPSTVKTKLHVWLSENPEVLYDFPDLARSFSPYTREGIAFGLTYKQLEMTAEGKITSTVQSLKTWESDDMNKEVSKKAFLIGRMLGQITETTTLFSMFGVCP